MPNGGQMGKRWDLRIYYRSNGEGYPRILKYGPKGKRIEPKRNYRFSGGLLQSFNNKEPIEEQISRSNTDTRIIGLLQ